GKQWDTLAILRVPDRDGQCTPACDSPRMGSHLLISRASFLVAIICLLSLFLSREPAALAQQTGVPTRVLPRSGPVRMAYYYPPDSASLDSLRANIRRLDIVATYWLEIEELAHVRSRATRAAAAVLRGPCSTLLPSFAWTHRLAGRPLATDRA